MESNGREVGNVGMGDRIHNGSGPGGPDGRRRNGRHFGCAYESIVLGVHHRISRQLGNAL